MIYDKLTNLPAYRGLSPALDNAIAYLWCGDCGLHALPQGRTDVDREEAFLSTISAMLPEKPSRTRF